MKMNRNDTRERRGKKERKKTLTAVPPRLQTIKPVLAAVAPHAPHDQARQVAVQVLLLLRGLGRLGGCGGGEARARGPALDRAAGHGLGGGGRGFRAARRRQLEVQRFDLGPGLGEAGGEGGELRLVGCGAGLAGVELLAEAGGFFGDFFLRGELGFEGCDELVGRWEWVRRWFVVWV